MTLQSRFLRQPFNNRERTLMMNANDQQAILAIALFAAFADGVKEDREREEIRRIAESLATRGLPTWRGSIRMCCSSGSA
jgi:uncharacterized membrane protein YebE (DUF533 family)